MSCTTNQVGHVLEVEGTVRGDLHGLDVLDDIARLDELATDHDGLGPGHPESTANRRPPGRVGALDGTENPALQQDTSHRHDAPFDFHHRDG